MGESIWEWDGQDARELLTLTKTADDAFVSRTLQRNFGGSVFGGLLVAQALAAAFETVDGQVAHSLHAYFLAQATLLTPLTYRVETLRDGRSSSLRHVGAFQGETRVLDLMCSFVGRRDNSDAQISAPAGVPPPESCIDVVDYVLNHADRLPRSVVDRYSTQSALERRPVAPDDMFLRTTPSVPQLCWLRLRGTGLETPAQRQCLLAYVSDAGLARTALSQHSALAAQANLKISSLDHALWFHGDAPAGDWVLYVTNADGGGGNRSLGRGQLFDRAGRLLASSAQEGLLQRR